jgi:hypothetical protein
MKSGNIPIANWFSGFPANACPKIQKTNLRWVCVEFFTMDGEREENNAESDFKRWPGNVPSVNLLAYFSYYYY